MDQQSSFRQQPNAQQKFRLRGITAFGTFIMAVLALVWVLQTHNQAVAPPEVSLDISQNSAQPGEVVTYTVSISNADPDQPFNLYMELPDGVGLYFVDGSLRVTEGDMGGASINGYSGSSLLEIEEIAAEGPITEFEIDMYIPNELGLYGDQYLPELSFEYGDVFTVVNSNSSEVGLLIDFPLFTLDKTRISGEVTPGGSLEYAITIANPNDGVVYDASTRFLEFADLVSESGATIDLASISIDGTDQHGQFIVNGPALDIDSIKVLPGNTVNITYTVILPKPLNDPANYQNAVDVGIPGTNVAQVRVVSASSFPVELSDFVGEWAGSQATLAWTTASENENQGFEVEHSLDDINYSVLGFVEGKGTTQSSQQYRFQTAPMESGNHIFRLRQIDISGGYSYSPRIRMQLGMPDVFGLKLGPNPFVDKVQLHLEVDQPQAVTLTVFDQKGAQILQQQTGQLAAQQLQTIELDLGSVSSGLYLLKVQGVDFQTIRRLVRNP